MNEQLKSKLQEAGILEDVNAFIKSRETDSFNAGVGKAYEEVDKATSDIFGTAKQEKQFTTEYLKSAARLFQQGVEMDIKKQFDGIEKENKELKDKLKSNPDSVVQEYNDLRKQHNQAIKDNEKKIEEVKNEYEGKLKSTQVKFAISSIPLEFPDADYKNYKINQFTEKLKQDGLLDVMIEQEGKIVLKGGEKHGHRDFNLEEMVKEQFKPYIKETGQPEPPKAGEPAPVNTKIQGATTKSEALAIIRRGLEEKNLTVRDDAWDVEYKKALDENKDTLDNLE